MQDSRNVRLIPPLAGLSFRIGLHFALRRNPRMLNRFYAIYKQKWGQAE